ncbi:MAG: hypothetical protein E7200_07325 [Selenomonas ruminantium]|nr:hypothetical protein [Selenomonas ruminantium]
MKDDERVCKRFADILQHCPKPVIIYGTERYAKLIARRFAHDIDYFVDRDKEKGSFMGKPLVPFNDVLAGKAGSVVMATGLPTEEIIYERIHEACEENNIDLYGIHSGRLISSKVGRSLSRTCKSGKELKERLVSEIDKHEIISFDIFDTLLMRYTLYPSDVFDITANRAIAKGINVPKNFKDYRQQAEVDWDRKQPGLDGIYSKLQIMLSLSNEDVETLKNIEMSVERDVLLSRPGMKEVLAYAHEIGKKVLLVSDMYLHPDFIREVLLRFDITGIDNIYISEYRGTDKPEDLFDIVKKENPGSSYLHIGDNPLADDWPARYHGIDSFLVLSALNMFNASCGGQRFTYQSNINDRILTGWFLANAYANPFILDENNNRSVCNLQEFCSIFIEPLAFSFVLWMLHEISNKGFEAVLFSARDGFVIKEMYQNAINTLKWDGAPRGIYFYVSRRLCLNISLQDEDDLRWVSNLLEHDMSKYMHDNFKIDETKQSYNSEKGVDKEWNIVLSNRETIFNQSDMMRRNYTCYLRNNKIDSKKRFAFFDMCSQGTSQRGLAKTILPNLYGVYMHRHLSRESVTMGNVSSFLPQTEKHMLANNVFEYIFTSPEPSVKGMDKHGGVLFSEENRSPEIIRMQQQVQDVVKRDFSAFLKICVPNKTIYSDIGQHILSLYRCNGFTGAVEVIEKLVITDDLIDKNVGCLKSDEI